MSLAPSSFVVVDGELVGRGDVTLKLVESDQAGVYRGRAMVPDQGSIALEVIFDPPDPEKQIDQLGKLVASEVDPQSGFYDECVELGRAWWRSFIASLGRPLSWREVWLLKLEMAKRTRAARRKAMLEAFELELHKLGRDELESSRYEYLPISIVDGPYRIPAWAKVERKEG